MGAVKEIVSWDLQKLISTKRKKKKLYLYEDVFINVG